MGEEKRNIADIIKQNIAYYDLIATEYDSHLKSENSNSFVRQKVSERFTAEAKQGWVLDFGGGTGNDLPWLLETNYNIIFCEPSRGMRDIAIGKCQYLPGSETIVFTNDENSDFRKWEKDLPFEQKVDAVLSNFSVLNCIPDLPMLFSNLYAVMKPGATFFAVILDNRLPKAFRSNLRGSIKSILTGRPITFDIHFKGHEQKIYLHSTKALRKASESWFNFIRNEPLYEYGFSLIHMRRK